MYQCNAVTVDGGRLKDFEAQIKIFVELCRFWWDKKVLMMITTTIFNSNVKPVLLCGATRGKGPTKYQINYKR
jgi:hypothetical protein